MRSTLRRAAPVVTALAIVGGYLMMTGSAATAAKPLARATLMTADTDTTDPVAIGTIVFKGTGTYANRVEIELELPTGAPGLGKFHGLPVHTTGACAGACTTAGGHWNPTTVAHGEHVGDLPSVLVGLDGTAYAEFETHRFNVTALLDAAGDGSAVVLHAGIDNFANVPRGTGQYQDPNGFWTSSSSKTGDAGSRYGCGVVTAA